MRGRVWQICPGLIRPGDSTPQVANKLRSALVNVRSALHGTAVARACRVGPVALVPHAAHDQRWRGQRAGGRRWNTPEGS
jgi:hypothetical protein